MKTLAVCSFVVIGVVSVLVAGVDEIKKVKEHKAKVKSAQAQTGDVTKAVGALKDQFASLKKKRDDLNKQKESLDREIVTANNSLSSVGTLLEQTKKSISDIHTAAIKAVTEAQISGGSSSEVVETKSLSTEMEGMVKLNKDTIDAAQKSLTDVRKAAIDIMG